MSSTLKTFAEQMRQAANSGQIEISGNANRAILALIANYEGGAEGLDWSPATHAVAMLAALHSDMEDQIHDAQDNAGDTADEIEDAIDRLEEAARSLKKFSRGEK